MVVIANSFYVWGSCPLYILVRGKLYQMTSKMDGLDFFINGLAIVLTMGQAGATLVKLEVMPIGLSGVKKINSGTKVSYLCKSPVHSLVLPVWLHIAHNLVHTTHQFYLLLWEARFEQVWITYNTRAL